MRWEPVASGMTRNPLRTPVRHSCGMKRCGENKQPTSATCRSCQATAGDANGNWRGGTTRHKAGYVMRHVPGHPRTRPRNPYVFEHILVMEEVLGRHLLPDETVHHLNGVKDDNRPENLATRAHRTAPTMLRTHPEHSWSWGVSNPRPPGGRRPRYDHSRDHAATAGAPPGQESTQGARCRVFPRCQRSFPPSVVSPYGPPLLLLPGCSGLAPCAVTGHWCSLLPSRN